MATVKFIFPDGEELVTESYDQLNLLAHAQLVERSLKSRCGGHCECGTCRVVLVSGRLSAMREGERELLARAGVTDERVRLACQSFPVADQSIVINVPGEKFIDARGRQGRKKN